MNKSEAVIVLFCFVGGLIGVYIDYRACGLHFLNVIISFMCAIGVSLLFLLVFALVGLSIVTLFS